MKDGETERKRKQNKQKRTPTAHSLQLWKMKIAVLESVRLYVDADRKKQNTVQKQWHRDLRGEREFPTVADRPVWRQMGN